MNNYNDSIEWETVRNKKQSPKLIAKKEELVKTLGTTELNENYVPKPIRDRINDILKSSDSMYEKIKQLKRIVNEFVRYKNNSNINWRKCLNIYIIYKSCQSNKHEIIANILNDIQDVSIYVNTVSSTKSGNTCLLDAAYYGSDMCINFLVNRGAKLDHVNKEGENIMDIITIGLKHAKRRYPNADKILEARYEECRRLIEQAKNGEKLPEVIIKEEEKEYINEINEFEKEYNFETLKTTIIEYIEDPSKFKKLVVYLKDNSMSELLMSVLDDEDIQDVLVDNPYVLKLV